METVEYFVLMERSKILCIYRSLEGVLCWRPSKVLEGPLEVYRVKMMNGVFTTQIIGVNPENFVPLVQVRQLYLPSEGV